MKRNEPIDVWKFIAKYGPDECWPWMGVRDVGGYGRMAISMHYYAAHRIVYALANPGAIEFRAPKKRAANGHVLHRCDNPACCNPAHLFVGSQHDNMRDMVAKGRSPDNRGERNPNAKLSDSDVADIRWIASKGLAPSEVAKRYGVSWTQAKRVMAGMVRHA